MTRLVIEGSRIRDLASFYAEMTRVFLPEAGWPMGDSLDALNDALYGGFGAFEPGAEVTVIWHDMAAARSALGRKATRDWLTAKLGRAGYDQARAQAELAALDDGRGPTLFDLVMTVFAEHPQVTLVPG